MSKEAMIPLLVVFVIYERTNELGKLHRSSLWICLLLAVWFQWFRVGQARSRLVLIQKTDGWFLSSL